MDYTRLRNQTLDSGQEEEAVTVNTRALIDKVLARYSGEWTTLRELIQNAADASASKVSIKFETMPSATVPTPQATDDATRLRHTMLHHTLRSLIVSNNGQAFAPTDWARLKRIAEGNPDETKIGAFGVGFYSVFAECENPFVASGNETMAFFWKGNSLFTRRGKLPSDTQNTDTCFVLEYRNTTSVVPSLTSVCQFLCTSMTFVGLEQIELWVDDWNILTLSKKAEPATAVALPRGIETRTREGLMRIHSIDRQQASLEASWMNIVGWNPSTERLPSAQDQDRATSAPSLRSFFSRLTSSIQSSTAAREAAQEEAAAQLAIAEDLTGRSQATVFIRVNHVHIKTQVSSSFAAELERATKKPPPKMTKIAILTSSYDETVTSLSTLSGASSKKVAEIVTGVLPRKAGRVFIGFPTAQTTGLLAHISAPSIIPTVERENIDLNARYVRTWNAELLGVAGIACRIAYRGEMMALQDKIRSHDGKQEDAVQNAVPSAIHILKQFSFRESTPLSKAGEIIEEYFWGSGSSTSIEILSSRGVKPSSEVRIASEDLSFVKGLAVVPDQVMKDAREFMLKIRDFNFISDITTTDIKSELEKQAIKEEQLHEFLKWAAKKIRCNELDQSVIKSLFAVTVVNVVSKQAQPGGSGLMVLGEMAFYINSSRISPSFPFPKNTVPFEFTKALNPADLLGFGWDELGTVQWLRWLINPATRRELGTALDATQAPDFAAQVLATVSKQWDTLSGSARSMVIELLSGEAVIPTKQGMRKPSESYFASVRLFDDLPTVKPSVSGVKEKFLKAIGVRKTVELSVILSRLMSQSETTVDDNKKSGWSHVDLVKYLVSVREDIPDREIKQLKGTAMCPAEMPGDPIKGSMKRYKVADLFEPNEDLRVLELPILQWPSPWNAYSPEGKFLRSLGLRQYPNVEEIIALLNESNLRGQPKKFGAVLRYFLDNYDKNEYQRDSFHGKDVAIVPAVDKGTAVVVKPSECFVNERSKLFGYATIRPDLVKNAYKLGVLDNPPIDDCANKLISQPPLDRRQAQEFFGYFHSRTQDLTKPILARLKRAAIIPVAPTSEKQSVRFTTAESCFLGDGKEYREIFDYVDFGVEANMFLLCIGCRHEPSPVELCRLVLKEPARIYDTLGTEKYLDLLRKIHLNMEVLRKERESWTLMKRVPFLLACNEKTVAPDAILKPVVSVDDDFADELLDDEPNNRVKTYVLRSAKDCPIMDNFPLYRLFKDHVAVAPQEEHLERLYVALGAPHFSSLVEEESSLGQPLANQREAESLRKLILERAQLFLHDQESSHVQHDTKWLAKNLTVQTVASVSVKRSLRYTRHSRTDACSSSLKPGSQGKAHLSITPKPDMYRVSQELVKLMFRQPKPQTAENLESVLTKTLPQLRDRGYNVDRILRKKMVEARNAELDQQRREEEERKKQQELDAHRKTMADQHSGQRDATQHPFGDQSVRTSAQTPKQQNPMPGAFDESPESPGLDLTRGSQPQPSRGLMSLFRRLGMDDDDSRRRSIQNLLGMDGRGTKSGQESGHGHDLPPYAPQEITRPQGTGTTAGGVTSAASIQQNLRMAINASRAHNSDTLFSKPQTNTVREVSSYCDSKPGNDLVLVSSTAPGLPVYIGKSVADPTSFVSRNDVGINTFAALLRNIGVVFSLPVGTLHVFYDENSTSIAFNSNGSIFCNYRFFAQLHQSTMSTTTGASNAFSYWWVTICHELAHNLVDDHSSDHSFYTEQFVADYFSAATTMAASLATQASSAEQGRRAIENGVERAFS